MVFEKVTVFEEADRMCEKAQKILDNEHIWASAWIHPTMSMVIIEVEGDWKHDHARTDWLMEEKLGLVCQSKVVTKEDGSDYYTATHYYQV